MSTRQRQLPDEHVFEVTGNVKPRRLGRVFPTGWTPLTPQGQSPVLVAVAFNNYNILRGTKVRYVETISWKDAFARQQKWDC